MQLLAKIKEIRVFLSAPRYGKDVRTEPALEESPIAQASANDMSLPLDGDPCFRETEGNAATLPLEMNPRGPTVKSQGGTSQSVD